MKIGLIGLGIMGRPMAKNLLKTGHDVVVSSHNRATAAELVDLGAKTAGSPQGNRLTGRPCHHHAAQLT